MPRRIRCVVDAFRTPSSGASEFPRKKNPEKEKLPRLFESKNKVAQHEMTMAFPHDWWISWFCQYLGLATPALSDSQRICAYVKFSLHSHGDHSHTCPQHSCDVTSSVTGRGT